MKSQTEKAVIGRINRRLAKEQQVLRTARGYRYRDDSMSITGRHYILNVSGYGPPLVATHVELDKLAAELGVA